MDVKLNFIRDLIKREKIIIIKISILNQIADCLTKTNPKTSFTEMRKKLGLLAIRGSVLDDDSKEVQKKKYNPIKQFNLNIENVFKRF